MDEDDLLKLQQAGSALSFGAGQVLIESGKPGTGLYVVVDGRLVVEAPETELASSVRARWSVSGRSSRTTGLRSARVRALTAGVVVAVDRAEVDRLCAEDPAFAERLAQTS